MVPKTIQGKNYFNPASKFPTPMISLKSKNISQSSLEKKKKERQFRNTVINDAENIDIVPIMELIAGKESTMDQELAICNKMFDIANYCRSQVCVQSVFRYLFKLIHSLDFYSSSEQFSDEFAESEQEKRFNALKSKNSENR